MQGRCVFSPWLFLVWLNIQGDLYIFPLYRLLFEITILNKLVWKIIWFWQDTKKKKNMTWARVQSQTAWFTVKSDGREESFGLRKKSVYWLWHLLWEDFACVDVCRSLHCPLALQFYLLIPTQALLSSYSLHSPLPCITSPEPLKSGFHIRSIRCHCIQLILSDTLPCPVRYFLCFVLLLCALVSVAMLWAPLLLF